MAPDETLIPNPMETDNIEWRDDSCRLTYEYFERGYGKFRVIEMDVAARAQRVLVGEDSDTFVDPSGKVFRHDLAGGDRSSGCRSATAGTTFTSSTGAPGKCSTKSPKANGSCAG